MVMGRHTISKEIRHKQACYDIANVLLLFSIFEGHKPLFQMHPLRRLLAKVKQNLIFRCIPTPGIFVKEGLILRIFG